jgi:peptidoglycan/LPS O-acetylase OafA/YrhL
LNNPVPTQSRNQHIDAWRGISISLVVIGHLMQYRLANVFHAAPFHTLHSASSIDLIKNIILRFTLPLPGLGVSFFFVTSGYLITSILLREETRNQSISIPAFYVRRIFRILPAFFSFLAIMAVLAHSGVVKVANSSFIISALFLADTRVEPGTWWLGHTWSLAVEEQFYLVWPLAFSLLDRAYRARWLAVVYVVLMAASYARITTEMWVDPGILGNSFPCIVTGALYACSNRAVLLVDRFATNRLVVSAVLLLLVQPFAASIPLVGALLRPINPALVAFIFFGSLRKATLHTGLLAQGWLSKIGLVSYSLYLWQQLFTGRPPDGASSLMLVPFLFILPAVASYYLLERPMIRVGHSLSSAIIGRRLASAAGTWEHEAAGSRSD